MDRKMIPKSEQFRSGQSNLLYRLFIADWQLIATKYETRIFRSDATSAEVGWISLNQIGLGRKLVVIRAG